MIRFCLFLLFYLPSNLFSQSGYVDSMLVVLESSNGKGKVNLHHLISEELKKTNNDLAIFYAKEGIKLGEEIKDTIGVVNNLNALGACYLTSVEYDKAIEVFVKATQWKKDFSGTYGRLAIALEGVGAYRESIKAENKLISYRDSLDRFNFYSFSNIGRMYLLVEEYDSAFYFFRKGLSIGEHYNDAVLKTSSFNNIGLYYSKINQLDSSLHYLEKASQFWEIIDNKSIIDSVFYGTIQGNKAKVYQDKKQFNKALALYKVDLKNARHFNEYGLEIRNLLSLSELQILLDNYSFAESRVMEAISLMRIYNISNDKAWSYLILKKIRVKQNRLKEALEYQELYISYLDSTYNNNIIQRYSDAKAYYLMADVQSKLKLQMIVLKNSELEKRQSQVELHYRTVQLWLIVGVSILILILLLLLIRVKVNQAKIAHQKVDFHKKEFKTLAKVISNKNQIINKYKKSILSQDGTIERIDKLKDSKILTTEDWDVFKEHLDIVFPGIMERLMDGFPGITKGERRLFVLIKLELKSVEISNMLGISPDSVKKSRQRLRKKINLDSKIILEQFILKF